MSKEDNNFIAITIALLKKGDYYGAGEHVDIAKGKYALVTSIAQGIEKIKRYIKK